MALIEEKNPSPEATTVRRFTGVSRLYGDAAFARVQAAHVVIVGIGGVGSWAAESLARSGVGTLTLIDLDVVAESNLNRQAHATFATLGRNKIDAMRDRILSYAPDCNVNIVDDFVTPENAAAIVPSTATLVIDAIDRVRPKAALLLLCQARKTPLIVCGGAGGKSDPTRIRCDDLTRTKNDALLAKLRVVLRQDHAFPRGKKKFHISAIYSEEGQSGASAIDGGSGLACAGYGSVMHMTAAMGLAAAGHALAQITRGP